MYFEGKPLIRFYHYIYIYNLIIRFWHLLDPHGSLLYQNIVSSAKEHEETRSGDVMHITLCVKPKEKLKGHTHYATGIDDSRWELAMSRWGSPGKCPVKITMQMPSRPVWYAFHKLKSHRPIEKDQLHSGWPLQTFPKTDFNLCLYTISPISVKNRLPLFSCRFCYCGEFPCLSLGSADNSRF